MLGSSYTGLHGDWISGNTVTGNQVFLSGLTQVHLTASTGGIRTITLEQACREAGGVDSDTSFCVLSASSEQTRTLLTAAFVPALVVMVLSG